MAKKKTESTEAQEETRNAQAELAAALTQAINATKPKEKKTVATRTKNTPWTPKDGSPKLKFKRKFYQHGIAIMENRTSNEEIALLNQLKPGYYCEGFVKVTLRKDRGIDIDYPVKTSSHRLKLINQFGIASFVGLLERLVAEKANPKNYRRPDDIELFDE